MIWSAEALEEILPHDVARGEPAGLDGELLTGDGRVLLAGDGLEGREQALAARSRGAGAPGRHGRCAGVSGPGRVEALRPSARRAAAAGRGPARRCSSSFCFSPGVVRSGREVGADLRPNPAPASPMSGHVVVVRRALAVTRAALAPEDEEHDDRDRGGDQPEEAQEWRDAVRRPVAGRPPGAAAPPPPSPRPRPPSARGAGWRRRLLGRVLDEVEVEDVVVVHAHVSARSSRVAALGRRRLGGRSARRVECTGRTGREGRSRSAANHRRDVSNAAYALPDRELVLDRYRPLRPIGRGGPGSVWLARDERSGLEIALKIVPREGKRAARAMREMEAASRLRHERCVRAYDFGGDEGHVYIAYEYVAGQHDARADALGEADRPGRGRDRGAGPRRARPRACPGHRPP